MKTEIRNGKQYRLPNSLTPFQEKLYILLIDWKWKHISKEPGYKKHDGKLIPYDAILPKEVRSDFPLIYPPILEDLKKQKEKFDFKFHTFFDHMASSQAANVNLFLPILLHPKVDEILGFFKPDFKRLAKEKLYHGFRIEYWDGNSTKDKGLLGDHNGSTGTDADIAIAYENHDGESCLWLIEHKLTEKEFTTCGGARSEKRTNDHSCERSFEEILQNKSTCYYHSTCGYKYWDITEKHQDVFPNANTSATCPFRKGMNQLWRNQLLALAIEDSGKYKHVCFSVVHHPDNDQLNDTLADYKALLGDNQDKFSVFTSKDLIACVNQFEDEVLKAWLDWYCGLYRIIFTKKNR